MELFLTPSHYIVKDATSSLWCCRETGALEMRPASWIEGSLNPVCLGSLEGVVGRVQYHPESEWRLLLITQTNYKGDLPGNHRVFQITKVAVLPLNLSPPPIEFQLNKCRKHSQDSELENGKLPFPTGTSGAAVFNAFTASSQKGFQAFKTFGDSIKTVAGNAGMSALALGGGKKALPRDKFEKKMTEEIQKMFNGDGPGGFYFSPTGDLTRSIQHQHLPTYNLDDPIHARMDAEFVWNFSLFEDLMKNQSLETNLEPWFVPIIFGFVQIDICHLTFHQEFYSSYGSTCDEYKLALVSRRSHYRAGTRYKRRGIDLDGYVANYVDTEQIIEVAGDHVVSFVQTRGSIPVYWSQPGLRYRPPPRLLKDFETNQEAFAKHFDRETWKHRHVNVISLVDESGKEKLLGDAYIDHILALDSPQVTYVTFDFHEYCRGLKFENVAVLLESIQEILKNMRYCWVDHKGLICEQQSVFRINCVDCLDRTNIVQTAIARNILEIQFRKVGLLPPEVNLPADCRTKYQEIWANNGDALSRQYAGTAALKGDFTRTGERRFAGLMKDGYNSASRYILNQFKDAYRQLAIDILSGQPISDDLNALTAMISGNERDEIDGDKGTGIDEEMTQECVKLLIDSCRKELLSPDEYCLGGWALIDAGADDADDEQTDMDIVLLLSQRSFYVASYDDEDDRITHFQRIPLECLERIEVGLIPEKPSLLRASNKGRKKPFPCIRLHFKDFRGKSGYSHLFRAAGLRFFNNMAVPIHTTEESIEALKAVYESFAAAMNLHGLDLPLVEINGRLSRHKSLAQSNVQELTTELCLSAAEASGATLPRNFTMSPADAFNNSKETPTRNLKNLLPGNVGQKLSAKLSPSNTSEFGTKIAGVGRGVNKLVSTLNPLKLSPNTMRRNHDANQRDVQAQHGNERGNETQWYNHNFIPTGNDDGIYSENSFNAQQEQPTNIPSISAYSPDDAPLNFPPAADTEDPASVSGALSRMKQSFSETSLGGIASAALGNLLDVNSVAFHASTGEIAMSGGGISVVEEAATFQYYDADPNDDAAAAAAAEMGGARGTFLKKLPLPKLSAASAAKMSLSPSTPQKAIETERELSLLDKINKSRSRVLRL